VTGTTTALASIVGGVALREFSGRRQVGGERVECVGMKKIHPRVEALRRIPQSVGVETEKKVSIGAPQLHHRHQTRENRRGGSGLGRSNPTAKGGLLGISTPFHRKSNLPLNFTDAK
jgi:hypothetical protein